MSEPSSPNRDPAPPVGLPSAPRVHRPPDLLLAHLHLRVGSLSLARAELETLAGRDALDDAGLVDLAEARWRTGDIAGAGEAAAAVLDEDGDGPLIALIVAAEAAVHRGRPTEARGYATRAIGLAGATLDDVFAGMPRGPVWPADRTAVVPPPPTLFDGPVVTPGAGRLGMPVEAPRRPPPAPSAGAAGAAAVTGAGSAGQGHAPVAGSSTPAEGAGLEEARPDAASMGLWTEMDAAEGTPSTGRVDPADPGTTADRGDDDSLLPAGDDALETGRSSLAAGRVEAAATQFGLALRLSPELATAVLDALEGRRDPALAFVRGDAYRLVGREADARRAFADAVRPDPGDPTTDHPPQGDHA